MARKSQAKQFIHETAVIEGNIEFGNNFSVWPNAVIRADEGKVKIGDNVSVQDNCVIHGSNVVIGNNVTIGHGAIIHGCKIGSNVLIGMNATILNNAIICDNVIIAAGSVVLENTVIPENSLAAGIPAQVKRKLEEKDLVLIEKAWKNYVKKIKERMNNSSFKLNI